MNYIDAVKDNMALADMIWGMLTDDLTDADLFVRPVPGANHLAWLLGHVIVTEWRFMKSIGISAAPLPEGFEDAHTAAGASSDGGPGFLTLAGYRNLMKSYRTTLLKAINEMTDADLQKPTEGRIAMIAPTVGKLLILNGNHNAFHTGQLSVIRRKLGKPVKF
ncbi:MAG: DinB family protein [Gemmataceae bacterium]|nr:DinB family protein [Gemmataceae bacterium]